MTQPTENKEPRQFLITHFSRKLAARAPISIRRDQPDGGRKPLPRVARRASPSRQRENLCVQIEGQWSRAHHGIKRLGMLRKCLTVLRVRHPSRLYISRKMAAFKSLGSKALPRPANVLSGPSSLPQLRPFGWRTLSWARSAAPSCRLQARSGSTSRLSSRKMPRGPFQTNLAGLGWSGSSGLINLLVVHRVKLKGRSGLALASLNQNFSYCIQPSSPTPECKDRVDIPSEA